LQLEVEHRGRRELVERTLSLPFALIGRDERADLLLDDKAVSHRHAYLQMSAGRWWWVDLDSRTGTYPTLAMPASSSDRRDICSSGPLLPRQGICVGPYTIRLAGGESLEQEDQAVPPNPLTSEADDPSSLPRWILEFRGGTAQKRKWTVDRPLTLVGRASFCKIRLHSPMVSRIHCALLNTPAGLWFIDLLGRDGTFIKNTAVRWARLEPGDELQIDPFLIRVHDSAPRALCVDPRSSGANSLPQELVSATPSLPANVNESLLMPLITQFSLMQQQMFEQFQQTLVMMAQTFGNLHREQLALVREELGQIQNLTRQLHTLQAQGMRQTPPPQPAPAQTPPPRSSVPNSPLSARAVPAPAAAACNEGDIHGWLSQRLASLQQERQTRWQKVLNVLGGKAPEV
jgi:pSer/pThr/pTyr-binding forkhead associated (FHA) protein